MLNVKQSLEPSDSGKFAAWLIKRNPRSYWDVVVHHLPLVVVSGTALLLPQIIQLQKLPSLSCTFLYLTGFPCPFCGFTRSFWAISHGEWESAFLNCPLAYGVFFFVTVLFLWNISALIFRSILFPGLKIKALLQPARKPVCIISLLFLLNWGYRLLMALK